MGDQVKITVIATGFRDQMPERRERMLRVEEAPVVSVPVVAPAQWFEEPAAATAHAPTPAPAPPPARFLSEDEEEEEEAAQAADADAAFFSSSTPAVATTPPEQPRSLPRNLSRSRKPRRPRRSSKRCRRSRLTLRRPGTMLQTSAAWCAIRMRPGSSIRMGQRPFLPSPTKRRSGISTRQRSCAGCGSSMPRTFVSLVFDRRQCIVQYSSIYIQIRERAGRSKCLSVYCAGVTTDFSFAARLECGPRAQGQRMARNSWLRGC